MTNKVALITGASRRIGAAIAKTLHAEGYQIALHCLENVLLAQKIVDSFNQTRKDSAFVFKSDLRLKESAQALIAAVLDRFCELSLLVNNASLFIKDSDAFEAMSELFAVNVYAPYALSMAAFDALSKANGSIINLTDIHADKPLKQYSLYCQTKAALTMQTKSLAKEFAPFVRVNAIAPGAIAWPENNNALSDVIKEKIICETPLKKHGEPSYIAQVVLMVAANPFITGQIIAVDGGRSIV